MGHALRRTSPKGGKFIGVCVNCGRENIPLSQANKPCKNWMNRTAGETLAHMIRSDA